MAFKLQKKPTEAEKKTQIVPGTTQAGIETARGRTVSGGPTGSATPSQLGRLIDIGREREGLDAGVTGGRTGEAQLVGPAPFKGGGLGAGAAKGGGLQIGGLTLRGEEVLGAGLRAVEQMITAPVPKGVAGQAVPIGGIPANFAHIPKSDILKYKGLTANQIAQVERALGIKRVSGIANELITNAKNIGLMERIITNSLTPRTIAFFGGVVAMVSTIFLGKWGQAESAEAINIPMRDALKAAEISGNWTTYDYAKAARDELTDLSWIERVGLWTPLISPFIGIPQKIEGVRQGGIVLDKIAEDKQIQQATGESDDDKWARVNAERAEQDKATIDYYNEQRKILVEWELEAKESKRAEDAAFWRRERENQRRLEKEDMEAQAKFWLEYRKQSLKIQEESRPSKLNFGLL